MGLLDVFSLKATLGLDSSEYEKGLGDAKDKATSIGSAIGGGLKTVAKVGGAALGVATTAMTAFGVASVKTGSEFDSSMSQVAATLGLTMDDIKNNVGGAGEAYDALREKAEEAGRSTIFSASESAEGLNILAMSGYDAEQSIAMLDDVLHLAAAGSMDMASAAGFISGTMKGFNDETKDSAYYADMMAKGATLANTSVSQLGEAMSSGAAGAAAYGQSADSMTVALLRLAEQGEVGAAAGTALSAAMKNLYTPTDQAKQALEELGVKAFDEATGKARDFNDVVNELEASMEGMTDEEKSSYKQTIFGIQGLDAYNKMVVTSIDKQNEWADALANSTGEASKQYGTMTDNLEGDIKGLQSALDGFKIAVSGGLMGSVREFVQFGTDGLSRITDAFKSGGLDAAMEAFGEVLSDGLNMIIEKVPEFVDAGMKLLSALGKGLLNNLPTITKAAVKVVGQLVNGLIKAIPAVTGGALQIVKGLADGLVEMIPELIPAAAEMIVGFTQALVDNIPSLLEGALDLVKALAEGILNGIPILIQSLPTLVQNLVDGLLNSLPELIRGTIDLVLGIVNALPDIIVALVDAIPQIIDTLIKGYIAAMPQIIDGMIQLVLGIVDALPQIIEALVQAIPTIVMSLVSVIIENGPAFLEAVVHILDSVWNGLVEYYGKIFSYIGQALSQILGKLSEWSWQLLNDVVYFMGYFVGSFIKFWMDLPGKIWEHLLNIIKKVTEFGTKLKEKATEVGKGFFTNIVNNITELPQRMVQLGVDLVNAVIDLPAKFMDIGSNIVTGIWDGISSGWSWLTGKVSELANSLLDGAKKALGIASPSKEFAWVGQMVDEGFAKGLDNYKYLIDDAMDDIIKVPDINATATTMNGVSEKGSGNGYTQIVNITSPVALTPAEVARQTRNATRDMVLAMSM